MHTSNNQTDAQNTHTHTHKHQVEKQVRIEIFLDERNPVENESITSPCALNVSVVSERESAL